MSMKKLFQKKICLALTASLLLVPSITPRAAYAVSNTPASTTATAQKQTDIQKIEAYFRTLKTAKARFVQTLVNGTQTHGNFMLSRPGKLRFEYDAPLKDFVVADGLMIYFYDGDLGEQTNAPISSTLADFLLRKELLLSGELTVKKIMRSAGLLQVSIIQTADPGAGTLTLGFTENPFQLKKWRIKDAQGSITEIELYDFQTGVKFAGGTFNYHDPDPKGVNE